MGWLASIPFPAVCIFMICGLVLRTSATFFIETHDRSNGDNARIILYECNTSSAEGSQPTGPTAALSNRRTLPPSYTTYQDIYCTKVVNERRKGEIYMKANFYLVVNPRLTGGRRIILDPASVELPRTIFMGVITVGDEAADYPALLRDLDEPYLTRLYSKCIVMLPARFLRNDMSFQAFGGYMGISDFQQFAQPVGQMLNSFLSFTEIVRRVQELFLNKIVHAKRNRVSPEVQIQARSDVKSAVSLLIRKLLDPCYVMSLLHRVGGPIFQNGIPTAQMEVASRMCTQHCVLLRAASSLYPNGSGCGHAVWDGMCVNQVCVCERHRKIFACSGPKHVTMIKCNNDIRLRLAASVNMDV